MHPHLEDADKKRRIPQQSRSRERVERLLDAAADLVAEVGVEQLSTRAIAERANIPVASLYQYFADRDEILRTLIQQELEALDTQIAIQLQSLTEPSIHAIVETIVGSMTASYRASSSLVTVWLRGRGNPMVRKLAQAQNARLTELLAERCHDLGLIPAGDDPIHAAVTVEVIDRCLQYAFEQDDDGDPAILRETTSVATAYLSQWATATSPRR